jgi:hypothetical protein
MHLHNHAVDVFALDEAMRIHRTKLAAGTGLELPSFGRGADLGACTSTGRAVTMSR